MRKRVWALLLAAVMLCSGCNMEKGEKRADTVVWIPVNPTEQPTEPETTAGTIPEETAESEPLKETEAETGPEETKAEEKSNSTGKKPSGNKGSSDQNNAPRETEPKATEPKETETKETEPAETEATSTEPAQTEPPATEPEQTEPVPTEPQDTRYDISGYVVGSLEYGIRDEINAAREAAPLNLDTRLCAIASCRAYEISRVWSHTRPDGRNYSTVLGDYGYSAGGVTELLVYVTGNGDGSSIVAKWLESDSHRQSLLNADFRTVGIGIYRAEGYTYVCCLLVN